MKKFFTKKSILAIALSVLMVVSASFAINFILREKALDDLQDQYLLELDLKKGSYSEDVIVLQNTTRARATELAEKTGVELPCYYSLSMDDKDADYFFCQCDECSRILEESGYSGYVIRFVNRIAREINKIYPFVKFETLAYVIFTDPPKDDTLPDKNVIMRLAADRSDISHGITTPANRVYAKWLRQWSDICKKSGSELHIWQ